MFFVQRVEMAAGAGKSGTFTLRYRMDMDRMKSFRKSLNVYNDQEPILGLTERSSSNRVPLSVLDIRARPVLCRSIGRVAPQGWSPD